MIKTLALYSSVDGQTKKICQRIGEHIKSEHDVTLIDIHGTESVDLADYEKVILGGSVRYGKHRPDFEHFLIEQATLLSTKKTLLFSVNATARKANKCSPSNNPYFMKLKHKTGIHADIEATFAGKLHLANNCFFDHFMIKLIFKMSGEQISNGEIEFTDWDQVDRISTEFQKL